MLLMTLVESVKSVLRKKVSKSVTVEPVSPIRPVRKMKSVTSKNLDVRQGVVYVEIGPLYRRAAKVVKKSNTGKTVKIALNNHIGLRKFRNRPIQEVQYYRSF